MINSRIHKTAITKEFCKIPNQLFTMNLTAAEIGLLTYLLHLPPKIVIRKIKLYKNFKDGKQTIRTIFNKLVQAGFIVQHKERMTNGTFDYWYEVFSTTSNIPSTVPPDVVKKIPVTQKPPPAHVSTKENYTRESFQKELEVHKTKYGTAMIQEFFRFYTTLEGRHLRVNVTKGWVTEKYLVKFAATSTSYKKHLAQKTVVPKREMLKPIREFYGKKE